MSPRCPGLAIVLLAIGFNILGDGLRDLLDPNMRRRDGGRTKLMLAVLLRRAAQMIPVILGVTFATFLLMQIIPGDPTDVLLGAGASDDARTELRQAMGFDRPAYLQYLLYLMRLLHGDLGQSLVFGEPVSTVLGRTARQHCDPGARCHRTCLGDWDRRWHLGFAAPGLARGPYRRRHHLVP